MKKVEKTEKTREEKKDEIPQIRTFRKKVPKSRDEDYFFPNERKTIRASSLEEAIEKLKGK